MTIRHLTYCILASCLIKFTVSLTDFEFGLPHTKYCHKRCFIAVQMSPYLLLSEMHHLAVKKCVMLLQRGDGRVRADVAIGGPLVAPTCAAHWRRRIAVVHLK